MGGKKKDKSSAKAVEKLKARGPEAFDALCDESARACPLVASGWLDDALEILLRAKFDAEGIDDEEQNNLLNGLAAPFLSFSTRIVVCRAFGLLRPDICELLHAIRRIRNHCAHSPKMVSLKDTEIQGPVRKLIEFVETTFKFRPDEHRAIVSTAAYLNGAIMERAWEATHGKHE